MFNFIKEYKFPYVIFNFFNKKKLEHNIPLYKKWGIDKKYYSTVSSEDFKNIKNMERKLDFDKIRTSAFYLNSSDETKESINQYEKNGYIIVKNFLDENTVNQINREVDDLLSTKKIKYKYGNKLMFLIHHSELIKKIGSDEELLRFLSILIDGEIKLFQSINFKMGSQQKTHSDSIHMTTFPLGGLLGVWIALEDVDQDNGALHYYPGSHQLPYYMNGDYDNCGNSIKLGSKGYKGYEDMLSRKVKELGLKKEIFNAKKGDMLIWHANILHGGEPHLDKSRTRNSMVFHYFDRNSICYHEITQRPAFFEI